MSQKPIPRRKSLGRPTLPIDASVIRLRRKDAGLSQLKLARQVYKLAEKGSVSDGVMKTSAYRWEKYGTMPPDMVHHLAKVLDTTVAVLQGGMPQAAPSRINEFQALIEKRLATGELAELNSAFQYCRECNGTVRDFAADLARDLEVAQLTQAEDEFRRLAVLTGLSMSELRRPMSFSGVWLFIASGPLTKMRHEILAGVSDVIYAVRTELEGFSKQAHGSDARVSFHEDGSWFRVTLNHGRIPQLTSSLRFVRCQTTEKGLEWVSPTQLDRFWLNDLPDLACTTLNFVTGFDSVQVPSSIKNLRVALAKYPTPEEVNALGTEAKSKLIQLCGGTLLEQSEASFEYDRVGDHQHTVAINYLTVDLWETLLPHLSDWPLECWSFRPAAARIIVNLDLQWRHFAGRAEPPAVGPRFSISLVDIAHEVPRIAPWQDDSVSEIHKRLCQELLSALAKQSKKSTPA